MRDPEGALADDVGALTEADGLRLARVPSVTQLRPEPERARHPLADDGGRDVHPRARHGLRVAEAHIEADDHLRLLPRHADRRAARARASWRARRGPRTTGRGVHGQGAVRSHSRRAAVWSAAARRALASRANCAARRPRGVARQRSGRPPREAAGGRSVTTGDRSSQSDDSARWPSITKQDTRQGVEVRCPSAGPPRGPHAPIGGGQVGKVAPQRVRDRPAGDRGQARDLPRLEPVPPDPVGGAPARERPPIGPPVAGRHAPSAGHLEQERALTAEERRPRGIPDALEQADQGPRRRIPSWARGRDVARSVEAGPPREGGPPEWGNLEIATRPRRHADQADGGGEGTGDHGVGCGRHQRRVL